MLVFTACYERAPVGPRDKLAIDVPPGTVQVILQQDQTTPGDTATFIVRVVANGVKVGAYQGSVTFTPGTLELVNVTAPTANGELYIVNPAGFANGRIRFAAYTTAAAFNDTEAFRFRAVAVRPLSETLLTGRLDVAGEPTGAALSRTTLRASHGLRDASTNLVILP
jgi:hypothetical protein